MKHVVFNSNLSRIYKEHCLDLTRKYFDQNAYEIMKSTHWEKICRETSFSGNVIQIINLKKT
jgi:hypothetical protein